MNEYLHALYVTKIVVTVVFSAFVVTAAVYFILTRKKQTT